MLEKVVSRFSIGNLSSQSTEKLRSGTLLCFTKILVLEKFRDKGGGAPVSRIPVKLFCLTVPNHFVDEFFCVAESFGYRKNLLMRREYNDFLKKICCITVAKKFVGEPISVSLNSGFENFVLEKVMSRFFIGNLPSQCTEKFRSGTLLCFTKLLVSKKLWKRARDEGRHYHVFLSKLSVSECVKNS